jgi:phospholipase D1/2
MQDAPGRRWRRPAWGKLGALALLVVALTAAWRYTPLANFATAHRMLAFARLVGATPWAPFALAAAYTPAAFIMFPRPLLSVLAIVAFGLVKGAICIVLGVLGAALSTYYIGRLLPPQVVRRFAGSKFEQFTALLRRHSIKAIFAANMLPTPPFAVQGITAGAIRMPLWRYMVGTLLSLTPGLIAILIFGHQIVVALQDSSKVSYLVLGGAAIGVALFAYIATRWSTRHASAADCAAHGCAS